MFSPLTATPRAAVSLAPGLTLRYREAGDRAAAPVIMLHGYSDSSFSFSQVIPLLEPNAHIFALDQRGHGDSDRPAGGYAMPDFAADVVAFMDAMEIPRATLVGHSMGTFVAMETALAAPERVAGLALLDSAADPRNLIGSAELMEAVEALEDPVPAQFVEEFQVSTAYLPLSADFLAQVVEESLKLPARVWKAALRGLLADGYAPRLGQIQAPTLLVWGEQDAIFARAEQEALLAGIARAELITYAETGHAPHWERPEQTARDLRAFFAEVRL